MKSTQNVLRYQLLIALCLIVSCSTDQDANLESTTTLPTYRLPEPKHVYPDSILRQVLDRVGIDSKRRKAKG
jgi:hypothetical protein